MADEDNETSEKEGAQDQATKASDQSTATPPAENQPPKEGKRFSQEEVDRIVEERLARERNKGKQQEPKKETKQESRSEEDAPPSRAEFEAMQRRFHFEKVAARHGYDDTQIERLHKLHEAERPGDTEEWLKGIGSLGFKPAAKDEASSKESADVDQSGNKKAPGQEGSPSKVPAHETDELVDVFSLSREDVNRLGRERVRQEFEKVLRHGAERDGAPLPPRALRNAQNR